MEYQKLTKDVLKLAFDSESEEELIAKLKENGAQFTEEEAKKLFDYVKKEKCVALGDDELEGAAGGGCFDVSDKYRYQKHRG